MRGAALGRPSCISHGSRDTARAMPAPIPHIDLAVADVGRSLAFYLDLLGPLGWAEEIR
jgi:hypothetical protein